MYGYEQCTQSDDKRCGIVEMSQNAPGVAQRHPGYGNAIPPFSPHSGEKVAEGRMRGAVHGAHIETAAAVALCGGWNRDQTFSRSTHRIGCCLGAPFSFGWCWVGR